MRSLNPSDHGTMRQQMMHAVGIVKAVEHQRISLSISPLFNQNPTASIRSFVEDARGEYSCRGPL